MKRIDYFPTGRVGMKDYYCVEKGTHPNGDHVLHRIGCNWAPEQRDLVIPLGWFSYCLEAIPEAEKHYEQVNGCYYCSNGCHST